MSSYVISIMLAFSAGLIGAVQSSLNAWIGKEQGMFVMIMGVSLIQVLGASVMLRFYGFPSFSLQGASLIAIAGIMGITLMFGVSFAIGNLGALPASVLVIVGQILAAAVVNHYGLFGLPRAPFSMQKLFGVAVIALGVYLMLKPVK